MTLRAILFDKDGTFVDFHATWSPATYAVMRKLAEGDDGKLADLVAFNHYDVGAGRLRATSPVIAQATADFGMEWAKILGRQPGLDFLRMMDELLLAEGLANVAPIGDPAAMFGELKAEGYLLGVVTNDSETGARAQCEKLGLTAWFRDIIGYDTGHGRKPEAGQILAFARANGLRPEETALVGDTMHDMDAARAAGCLGIAVLTGFATAEDFADRADHVLPDIMALPDLLRRLKG